MLTVSETSHNAVAAQYIRTSEVAKRLNVTTRTIARWIGAGFFPGAFKVNPDAANSPFVIPVADVRAFEEKQRNSSDRGDDTN